MQFKLTRAKQRSWWEAESMRSGKGTSSSLAWVEGIYEEAVGDKAEREDGAKL